jgi:hypothetical protein
VGFTNILLNTAADGDLAALDAIRADVKSGTAVVEFPAGTIGVVTKETPEDWTAELDADVQHLEIVLLLLRPVLTPMHRRCLTLRPR